MSYVRKNGGPAKNWLLPLAAFLLVVLCTILFFRQEAFLFKGGEGDSGTIELFFDDSSVIEGENLTVRAYSSCGGFSIYLDERAIAEGESYAKAAFLTQVGTHLLVAKNNRCNISLSFHVENRECISGQEKPCFEGGCEGKNECEGGRWGRCILPKKICQPGTKSGCNLDGCKFGYSTCNSCGSAFGPCLPKDDLCCK